MAKAKVLSGQIAFDLFDKQKREPPNYAQPCPIRDECGAYHCETGGCSGERGWCERAQKATRKPGNCLHESRTVDIGGGKSYCDLMQVWTNCREVGTVSMSKGGEQLEIVRTWAMPNGNTFKIEPIRNLVRDCCREVGGGCCDC